MQVREIKTEAKERFALNRYHAMLVYGVVFTLALNIAVLTTVLSLLNIWAIWYGIILIFLFLLMLAPFGFGMTGFYLKLYRFEKMDAFHIFDGFNKYNLERVVVLKLLKTALWLAFTLLLIVPGVIFSIRTSMATYLLRANPKLKPKDALKASNRIMKGHSGKYFHLAVSFVGWWFMGLLTCGLGYIWVAPYFNTAKIVFYKRELQGDKTVYRNPLDDAPHMQKSAAQTEEEALRRKLLAELVSLEARAQMQAEPKTPEPPDDVPMVAVADNQISFADWNDAQNWSAIEKMTYKPATVELNKAETSNEPPLPPADGAPAPEQKAAEHAERPAPPRERSERAERAQNASASKQLQPQQTVPQQQAQQQAPSGRRSALPPHEQLQELPSRASQRVQDALLRQKEYKPLPGGRVVQDVRGNRVMERRRPLTGAALPEADGKPPVEIGENGENKGAETVQERLLRLRAERAAKEQHAPNSGVEIGEEDA